MQKQDRIRHQLAAIVSPQQIQPWDAIAGSLQDQISQAIAPTHTPTCIVYPQTQAELAEIVTCIHQQGWTMLPCGNGSKLHWGGLGKDIDVVISTSRLTQIIEHAVGDLTITVEAGITLAALQQHLAPVNQWLPLDPNYANSATLGGILATADAGVLRQRYGGARDMVIGLSMVRTDGQLAKAGGRVVKNVAGYDLMKLLTGSWGSLGMISQVTLRLYPQPPASQTVYLRGSEKAIQSVTATLFASSLTPTAATVLPEGTAQCLTLVDNATPNTTDNLILAVQFQSIPVSLEQQVGQLEEWGQQQQLHSTRLEGTAESTLWHQLHTHMESQLPTPSPTPTDGLMSGLEQQSVTCKVGVLPAEVVLTLAQLQRQYPGIKGWINIGNGLGMLQIDLGTTAQDSGGVCKLTLDGLGKMRSLCEANGGFLTLLAAPKSWKQQLEPSTLWGYSGNALPVMTRLKQQFDPEEKLSPGRFLV